jgi:hypothetical protein
MMITHSGMADQNVSHSWFWSAISNQNMEWQTKIVNGRHFGQPFQTTIPDFGLKSLIKIMNGWYFGQPFLSGWLPY